MVTDIPGAPLHADMEGTVHLMLEGEGAESIVYGKIRKERQCSRYNSRWHCTVHYKQPSGNYNIKHYRSGVSRIMTMTEA